MWRCTNLQYTNTQTLKSIGGWSGLYLAYKKVQNKLGALQKTSVTKSIPMIHWVHLEEKRRKYLINGFQVLLKIVELTTQAMTHEISLLTIALQQAFHAALKTRLYPVNKQKERMFPQKGNYCHVHRNKCHSP